MSTTPSFPPGRAGPRRGERVTGQPVVLANPASGPGGISLDALREAIPVADVREVEGPALADAVKEAVAGGAAWVGVCGGDGSQRTAAIVLAGSSTPLLPVPGGTRNHFARALGLCDLDAAGAASRGDKTVQVDLGDVNGEVFVNNASIGFYAALVRERKRHEGHRPKRVADVAAAWEQARRGHRFPVDVDGTHHRAWLVFVGNGCYGSSLFDLAERESLDDGKLDLRVVTAERRFARVRVVAALLTGRLGRSPVLEQVVDSQVDVAVLDVAAVDVALDGEVTRMSTPLCFRSRAGALRVLVP